MSNGARPFFPWVGGKEKLAPCVYQVLPPRFSQYTEPFGGSGAVLLGLPPDSGRLDIYNDLDADLANLFLCVKERPNALIRELRFLPIHSRAVFLLYKDFLAHEEIHWEVHQKNLREELSVLEDRTCFTEEQAEELRPILRNRLELYDVERAAAFYRNIRGSFSGTVSSFGAKPPRLYNFLHLIWDASKRLEDVVIENKDALPLIRERDRPDGVLYCDPPYFQAEQQYRVSMHGDLQHFHVQLWKALSQCVSFVVLSYNDCPFIRKLYQDFYILAFRRSNPLAKRQGAEYGELILTNYDPRPYLARQLTLFETQAGEQGMELVHIPNAPLKTL